MKVDLYGRWSIKTPLASLYLGAELKNEKPVLPGSEIELVKSVYPYQGHFYTSLPLRDVAAHPDPHTNCNQQRRIKDFSAGVCVCGGVLPSPVTFCALGGARAHRRRAPTGGCLAVCPPPPEYLGLQKSLSCILVWYSLFLPFQSTRLLPFFVFFWFLLVKTHNLYSKNSLVWHEDHWRT